MSEPTLHIGRKISRIRELRGMKQEALAAELGISQQAVSKIEQSAEVEDDALEKIAKALGVPVEGIRKFNEEAVFNIIGNTVNNHDQAAFFNYYPTFNPIDKLVELFEENKRLYQELLQSEREKVEILRNSK
ncbi:helix-turn-helix transcriptional regulator [Mucilaginibacter sp. BJC16-A38]|uniref:helix-turn-helix domain-containing protein n=1 Tax=Mucilaginibacter phenanthrenivorans TaxID=1234842 RepID=UPI0021577221|nr:helix-turn-helix transcriptional regulator [Mucilaginibacter phenanthrenivorans]MCR8560477.1 helix-turn-helix transcriptional regulator [Mucilaginibacter phenanthrenivorans]